MNLSPADQQDVGENITSLIKSSLTKWSKLDFVWVCRPTTGTQESRKCSLLFFLKIFASRSFFEMISIQYLWKVPLQFWVYFDCNDTFRSPEEFKAIDWDYLDLCHYHRVRQKQRRGVLWIKALIWHKLQLSVYKWSSDIGTNIVDISHNRHNRRWCTFFRPVPFFPQQKQLK